MSKNLTKISFFSLLLLTIISLSQEQKYVPKITIYVESLCPFCLQLITTVYKEFRDTVTKPNLAEVEFITFGNAKEVYNTETKKYEFTCQHGENECYGNLVETCAIQTLGKVQGYDTLICIESNIVSFGINFDKALEFCLQNDQENLELVKECVTSDLGNLYQHEMAQKTGNHSWVPWVMVDGVHDLDAEDKIFESLIDYLCGDDITKCY